LQDHTGGQAQRAQVTEATEDITFRYCTECFLRGHEIDSRALRQRLAPLGNSLIIAGGGQSLRVHIHTNEPETVFKIAAEYGEVVSTKHDDMWAQHQETHGTTQAADIALITDSTCDLPPDYLIRKKIHIVPLTVNFGPESYLDRVSITNREFYKKLAEGQYYPTTSQPAPADFRQAFELASENHKAALAILISSALSGTYQAGVTAANFVQDLDTEVIDSKTLSGSLGLLLMVAAEAVEEGCSLEEIKRRVQLARERVKLFASVRTTKFLVRGGRLSKSKGLLSRLFNIQPVLTVRPEGDAGLVAKTRGGMKNREKTLELIKDAAQGEHERARRGSEDQSDETRGYTS
jgi:DegV family protein with EDD domain